MFVRVGQLFWLTSRHGLFFFIIGPRHHGLSRPSVQQLPQEEELLLGCCVSCFADDVNILLMSYLL
jgi:hypothetical protein